MLFLEQNHKINIFTLRMKYPLIIILLPHFLCAQDIIGIWKGSLYNDSTQKIIPYEMAITEYNGKIIVYSYTNFLLDNQNYEGVKSIKIMKVKDHYFFEDVDLIYNNYPVAPPKGVKQISSVMLSDSGKISLFNGKFITRRTREYGKQITGTVHLEKSDPHQQSRLISILESLDISKTLSFIKMPDSTSISLSKTNTSISSSQLKNAWKKKEPETKKTSLPKKVIDQLSELVKRKIETIETIYFTTDSLELTLYDNGYVDGDSVSLIVNGKILLEHQRLSTQAIIQNIRTEKGITDSINIIMYAENLGSISPNSGLLVIRDGEKRYEVTFSGDLEKNAAILLKRKK